MSTSLSKGQCAEKVACLVLQELTKVRADLLRKRPEGRGPLFCENTLKNTICLFNIAISLLFKGKGYMQRIWEKLLFNTWMHFALK